MKASDQNLAFRQGGRDIMEGWDTIKWAVTVAQKLPDKREHEPVPKLYKREAISEKKS